jgi:hypothetical protein
LINITKEYHNRVCKDYQCIDYTKSTKSIIYLEPNTGIIFSGMGLKKSNHKAYNIKPSFGVNVRFSPLMVHYLWNFSIGLYYSMNNFNGDFKNTIYYKWGETYRIHAVYSFVYIPLMLEYSFPTKKFQPFLTAGFDNIFIINSNTSVRIYYPDINYLAGEVDSNFRGYHYGIQAGFGLRYIKSNKSYFFIKCNYEFRKPASSSLNDVFDYHYVNSVMLNVGYGFSL